MMTKTLRRLQLEDLHSQAGARFGAFAGWNMPVSYPAGVMKEHLHTREHVGIFDISHMKLIRISGSDAADLLDHACPIEARALRSEQSKYTLLLSERAGIIDDLIVTRLGDERFMVVANAGNAATDEAHLRDLALGLDVNIEPLDRVFLAIQGPEASAVLAGIGIETEDMFFMQGREIRDDWFMSRSGYTGEDGFEIGLPEHEARQLLGRLMADERIMWIGLAARDSLRLEAGLCLHGNDITPDIDPASAALMWAIPKDLRASGKFLGSGALRKIIAEGPNEKRVGLKPDGRQPVRGGTLVFDEDGEVIGRVTSGGFGPSAGFPVATGFVASDRAAIGTMLYADVRGTKVPVAVHSLPFTLHRYRKG
ncbi:aminomethyltransferase [Neorhizobium galegae]|uniref:glycine cleavage system aminomethyltransferase GcvT n=1 Tax=Neorhizobium galegae TaxID=399 RepID=UPI001AEAC41E|nr:glycine cleavage system aminomethyltransferase GcvT [Neorhizobium galegae]MBP2562533.1 aminomethyltransferase [Neorhizobium galegae]